MGLNDEYKENLYNDVVGFLHSVFIIDEISFENIKPLEPLTFERVLNRRYELEKKTSLILNKVVFIENELVIMKDYKKDLETFAKQPNTLLCNPFYDTIRGYIYFLEEQLPRNEPAESKPSSTGKKGRPPGVNKPFRDFFNCTEEEYQQIIKLLKERHSEGSATGIGAVISALKEKKYFIYDQDNDGAKLHKAIGTILGNVSAYRNFKRQIEKNPDEKVKELLP